jgi:hypothetical protein
MTMNRAMTVNRLIVRLSYVHPIAPREAGRPIDLAGGEAQNDRPMQIYLLQP